MDRPAKETLKSKRKRKGRSQSERFIETARMLGADESGRAFEAAFRKIVPTKESAKQKKKKR